MRIFGFFGIAGCLLGPQVVQGAADPVAPSGNIAHLQRLEEVPEKPWRHLFAQNKLDLKPDQNYLLTFWAKSSQPLTLRILTKVAQPPWAGLKEQKVELTTDWQRFELMFDGENTVPGQTRLEFRYGGQESGDIWIGEVAMHPEGSDQKSETNLILNGRFEDQLSNWYIEGQQPGVFLVGVQSVQDASAEKK